MKLKSGTRPDFIHLPVILYNRRNYSNIHTVQIYVNDSWPSCL